jgi:hypothetical protein
MMMRTICRCALISVVTISVVTSHAAQDADPRTARPMAIVAGKQPDSLLIADSLQGRVIRVNTQDRQDDTDDKIGESLVDLARLEGDRFVAIDATLRQLICFRCDARVTVTQREALALVPSRVAVGTVDPTHHAEFVACVTSRWSQAVQMVRLSTDNRSRVLPPIPLGFEAHEVLQLPNRRFLVADAFAGWLAVIDSDGQRVESTHRLRGHNIRGLALTHDGSTVLISHQVLSRVARSDLDDVHWGSLMQNVVSRVPIEALSRSPAPFHKSVRRVELGDTGRGFADPTGIVALPDGFAVLSGGARQLSIYNDGQLLQQVDVGRRPTRAISFSRDRLAVTNEHDGTVSIIELTGDMNSKTIELSQTGSPVSEGEAAFYDASLSHDSWMTCNSCHVDAHTPGLLADTFGDNSFGDAKLIPSLLGARVTSPYDWLGNKPKLSDQIAATVASTMHAQDLRPETLAHLVDFVERLEFVPTQGGGREAVESGRQLFTALKCNECHVAPTFTSGAVRDIGMRDATGNQAFNPPSQRGLRYRRAYFHDARAGSLEAVFREHRHQLSAELSTEDLQRLLTYLNSL